MNDSIESQDPTRSPILVYGFLLVVLSALVIALTTTNYRFAATSPGGNDFIPRWMGTKLLLERGQNPYSDETSMAIQQFIYGRPANVNEDQVLFVYPLYSALLFSPFAMIDNYALARAIWMTTLELALIALAVISIRVTNWRPALPVVAFTLLFALIWYHGARPLINGNPSILMAFFVGAALLAIRSNKDIIAGMLLALSTIKPQAVILFVPLILIWAYSNGRFRLIIGTLVSLAMLVLVATLVEPTWLIQNVEQVAAYPDYTLAGTPGAIFESWWPVLGHWPGYVLTLIIIGLLIWQWRRAWNSHFEVLLPVALLTLAATNLIGITTAASNYVALFPGVILLAVFMQRDKSPVRDWPALLLMTGLLVGLWMLFWTSRSGRAQSPIMFFPLPVLLILTLPFMARAAKS
jgi:hypothetical protein